MLACPMQYCCPAQRHGRFRLGGRKSCVHPSEQVRHSRQRAGALSRLRIPSLMATRGKHQAYQGRYFLITTDSLLKPTDGG